MRTKTKYSYQFIEAMTYRKFSDTLKKNLEKKSNEEKMKKKNPLDTFKFKIHPKLEMRQKSMPKQEVPRRIWASPESLLELCTFAMDKKPLPEAFNWSSGEVLRWIDKIGFSQYKETFSKNFINGRKLLLLTNASHLVAMNIKNLEHIHSIIASIRKLFGIEKLILNRSIYYPPYNYDTHYKFYRIQTGLKYDKTRYSDLFRKMQLIKESSMNLNHWQKLENWLEHHPNRKLQIVANAPKTNLYAVKKPSKEIVCKDENVKIWCDCVPPCECEWKKSDYRPSWKLSVLEKNELTQRSQDLMESISVKYKSEKEEDNDKESNMSKKSNSHQTTESCHCMPPCTCDWKIVKAPSTIGILKKRYSIRYSFGEQSIFTNETSDTEALSENYHEKH